MGLFDFLFGSREQPIADSEQLRTRLFEVAQTGDARRLEALCRTNRALIVQHFPSWQRIPQELRNDSAAVSCYAQGLIAVAELFAHRLNQPDLLQRLMGSQANNPLARWEQGLQQTQQLMTELRYGEAQEALTNLLIDGRELKGSGVDLYLPVTLGRLGECYFQNGKADQSLPHLEEALRLCEQSGDTEGVAAYLGSLFEVQRYRGQAATAAGYAERLAEALQVAGQSALATRYRRRAKIVRAGEPLLRIVTVVDDVPCELDEVAVVEGKRIQFVFERNRLTLQPAVVHTQRGEQHGKSGRFDAALAEFREAAQADAFDPHARFLAGFTLLHLQQYADAVESFQKAEQLAPGWFHCRSDLWLAEQLALGRLSHEVFLGLHALEDGAQSPAEKLRLAELLLSYAPELAHLHLLQGKFLATLGRTKEAEASYRRGLASAAEPDVKTRLFVELGVLLPAAAERDRLLREAQTLNGNLVAAASATLALRASAGVV